MLPQSFLLVHYMEFLLLFNQSILPIFIIIIIAALFNKFFKPDLTHLNNLSLAVFAPALVFDSLVQYDIEISALLKPFIFMLLLSAALLTIATLTSYFLRLQKDEQISFILSSSMINMGNFGIPLIFFTFGQEAISHSIIFLVIFNIPLSTLAIYLSSNQTKFKNIIIDIFKIPIVHALILALIFASFQIELPMNLKKGIGLLGSGAIPLLLFVLGIQLSNMSFKKNALGLGVAIGSAVFIRLIISPILAYPLLKLIGMPKLQESVALLQTSGPSALLPLLYAIRFNKSPELLASIIFITTLLSGFTLPFIIRLI